MFRSLTANGVKMDLSKVDGDTEVVLKFGALRAYVKETVAVAVSAVRTEMITNFETQGRVINELKEENKNMQTTNVETTNTTTTETRMGREELAERMARLEEAIITHQAEQATGGTLSAEDRFALRVRARMSGDAVAAMASRKSLVEEATKPALTMAQKIAIGAGAVLGITAGVVGVRKFRQRRALAASVDSAVSAT